jgi:hypothetical protein
MTLKTLKEIRLGNPTVNGAYEHWHNVVDCYELREAAKEWVNHLKAVEPENEREELDFSALTIWIKQFFNLEEKQDD